MFISSFLRSTYLYFLLRFVSLTTASPAPTPTCYDDDGQYPAPLFSDCIRAMSGVKNSPYFTRPQTYGAYEDPPRNVPLDWRHKTCLVSIDADDGSKIDHFALSTIMPAIAVVGDRCIKRKIPGQGFGGFIAIGHGKSFYAIVQYDPGYPVSAMSSKPLILSNETDTTTSAQDSEREGVAETS